MKIFDHLRVWIDPIPRTGEMNMAIDEVLFNHLAEEASTPFLRLYQWSEPTVSFGYFEKLKQAKASFPADDLNYVRRWTGGGIVDHRIDLTYTLGIPKSHKLAQLRGAESYKLIHQAVADALAISGVECELVGLHDESNTGDAACFQNPVAFDIIDSEGNKLAGAGQKRTRLGLLHQGSVLGISTPELWEKQFINNLTEQPETWHLPEAYLELARPLANEKYGTTAWLEKYCHL